MFQFMLRMFYIMGIDWQLWTHLATPDALLVTKKGKISREDVTPPPYPDEQFCFVINNQ